MSVDMSAAAVQRTTNVPQYQSTSWSMWVNYLTSSPPTDYTLISIDNGSTSEQEIGRNGPGPTGTLAFQNDTTFIDIRTHAQLLNTWTWVGLISGANSDVYWSVDAINFTHAGTAPSNSGTPTIFTINSDGFGNGHTPALIYGVKVFDVALSLGELMYEAARSRPAFTMNTWVPLLNQNNIGVNYGGTGGDLTVIGTPAASQLQPAIPWKG